MADISNERKRELEEPDQFVEASSKALVYANEKKYHILTLIIAIFFICVGITFYLDSLKSKEVAASESLSKTVDNYEKLVTEKNSSKALKEFGEKFEKFIDNHSGTTASGLAMIKYGDICFKEGNFEKAVVYYKKALNEHESGAVKNIILCNLGYTYEALKDNKNAKDYFLKVKAQINNLKKDEALFHFAMIYESEKDTVKSQEIFNTLKTDFSDSVYADLVKEKTN